MKSTRPSSRLAIRITGALIAVTFLTTATLLLAIYFLGVRAPMSEVRQTVAAESRQLEALYEQYGQDALVSALIERRRAPSSSKAFDAFIEANGTVITTNLPSWPQVRRGEWSRIEADLYRDGDEDDHESLSRDLLLQDGKRLIVGKGDEFDELGLSLNAMLDRNEELVASLGRVSDSIAHELRTPLARLLSALDAMDRQEAGAIEAAKAEAERLQQTFDALLRIARLDTGRHRIRRDPVQLDELVTDAVEFYAPEAEARGQDLIANLEPCAVTGDRDLLFQAVANVLDNGIKFAPRNGSVRVRLKSEGSMALLAISDTGPGVPNEHRRRLSERFYRAPGSESVSGTGLGLTLTEAIVSAHHGNLGFAGVVGDFSAEIRLPLSG